MTRMKTLRVIPLLIALLGVPALAADRVAMVSSVPFVSGGIGFDEQQSLAARAREFNLKLLFTLNEGNYVADVGVVIRDARGTTVLQHEALGPFVMAKLPSGTYNVTATYEGRTHTRQVSVGNGLRTEHFRWPSNPQTDFPAQS